MREYTNIQIHEYYNDCFLTHTNNFYLVLSIIDAVNITKTTIIIIKATYITVRPIGTHK